jgi:hypothetical protein
MVSRSKVSKQITRRAGGTGRTKRKGTTVAEINRMREDWIDDPDFEGTPGPYNIRKKVHRKKRRNVQSPNPMGMSKRALEQAKRSRRIKRLQGEAGAAADRGRAARKAATDAISMRGAVVPRKAAVKVETLHQDTPSKKYPSLEEVKISTKEERPMTEAEKRARAKLDEKKKKREEGEYEDFFVEKTGGKLSRKKGGRVKKKRYSKGGKVKSSNGSAFVASLYK